MVVLGGWVVVNTEGDARFLKNVCCFLKLGMIENCNSMNDFLGMTKVASKACGAP